MNETPPEKHFLSEIARLERYTRDLLEECGARGEILDEIQKAAGSGWWYGAIYVIGRLKRDRVESTEMMRQVINSLLNGIEVGLFHGDHERDANAMIGKCNTLLRKLEEDAT